MITALTKVGSEISDGSSTFHQPPHDLKVIDNFDLFYLYICIIASFYNSYMATGLVTMVT